MPVVAEDFVGRSGVLIGERSTPSGDLHHLARKRTPRLPAPDPLQTLLGGTSNGCGYRLPSGRSEFAHGFLGGRILYIQWHRRTFAALAEIICQ